VKTLPLQCFLLFLFLLCVAVLFVPAQEKSETNAYIGSLACAACHRELYASYSVTAMALSSGKMGSRPLLEDYATSEFLHSLSGVRYRIFKEEDRYFFEFTKQVSQTSRQEIQGRRQLDYFIGSGAVARGYLFSVDGFLFQAPVSYYPVRDKWDMAPGYELYKKIMLSRPVRTNCLICHASNLQPIEGTENRYREMAFLEDGISCERCHGPGRKHIAKMTLEQTGDGNDIVNPVNLEPLRRDSICAQCHLVGEVQITKAGRSLSTFRPGDRLSDHVVSFVWSPAEEQSLKVIGHVEKLGQSACKKASGPRLWCGSCHDPHSVPGEARRAEYFRQKCLSCHKSSECKSNRKSAGDSGGNCVACHMPKSRAMDGGHSVMTDHSIPRLPGEKSPVHDLAKRFLLPFGGGSAEVRDLGLAYAKIAVQEQSASDSARAFELLKEAEKDNPDDAQVLVGLAYLYDRMGDENKAIALYKRAVQRDPAEIEAAVNLGSHLAKRSRFQEAILLWEDALSRNAGLETAKLNLALAYLRVGNAAAARSALLKALEYDPDLPLARKLLSDLPD
jgi:Tetratricopeptide repeat/Cytochrome c554 and c-prime